MSGRPGPPGTRLRNLRSRRRLDELSRELQAITTAYERLTGRPPGAVPQSASRDETVWGPDERSKTG